MFADPNYHYAVGLSDVCSPYEALRPPKRVSVAQGAQDILILRTPGTAGGPWSPDKTPYTVEPMNMLASRKHEAVCFVGPARTGKTASLLLGWMAHNVKNDPGDMLFIQMSQEKAREFSKTDIERALKYSPALAELNPTSQDDNTYDKMFRHGMWLRIGWPTVSNVSGSTYRYVAITDIDRMKNAENVDGEGPLFALALKRTQTYGSRGMALVESSPGIELVDPNWKPATPHEAPPTTGILGIYNRSDRRRWYWRCPHCSDWMEAAPGLGLFNLPQEEQLLQEIREIDIDAMALQYGSRVICPHGCVIDAGYKSELNAGGKWISEAEIMGTSPSSPTAGYWMGGLPAHFQNWRSLVSRYLYGLRDYALNGSEETLKSTTNLDQGMPFMSMHLREASRSTRSPDQRTQDLARYTVPEWARMVVASVDVQGGSNARFVVQVHAVGQHFEQQLVNRFTIKDSRRKGMGEEYAPLDPAAYPEDWDRITDEVVRSTYRTPIEGREIKVLLTVIDTGGEDGVTANAYNYYRRMRRAGLQQRIMLYKGEGKKTTQIIRESMVGLRKDVPLYICNTNLLSDAVKAGLDRERPGPGYFHFPKVKSPQNPDGWIVQAFFDELKAEVRNPDGTWSQIKKRNESFDLCRMIHAGLLRLGVDKKSFWDTTPHWARPLAENSELVTAQERRAMKAESEMPVEQMPLTVRPVRRERRVAQMRY